MNNVINIFNKKIIKNNNDLKELDYKFLQPWEHEIIKLRVQSNKERKNENKKKLPKS